VRLPDGWEEVGDTVLALTGAAVRFGNLWHGSVFANSSRADLHLFQYNEEREKPVESHDRKDRAM
jgi:hypothetical protein